MDIISINNLSVFAYHGVMPEENVVGQKFDISVDMYTDCSAAADEDDISKSVNYADVCRTVKEYVEENTYNLIETLAERLAEQLLLEYNDVEKLILEIKKPWAPVHMPLEDVSVRIERGWHTVYLSLGSNMGDREGHLDKAVAALGDCFGIQLVKVSDYIETAPVGNVEQDDFINAAVMIRTLLEPHRLLEVIHGIEADDDRVREIHWGPRTIDIDIILYDEMIIGDPDLVVPHIEAVKREFVLKPLAQIAPYAMHPVYRKTIYQIYKELIEKTDEGCDAGEFESGFTSIDMLEVNEHTRIAYFGVEGTHSQQAMEDFFGESGYQSFPLPKFTDVMKAVNDGAADYGVFPIENSSTGGITDIYDHMHEYNIYIVGEQIVRIEQALLGLPGSTIEGIRTVYSHTQGIRQCSSFLEQHPYMHPVTVGSTATGAKRVMDEQDITHAAIASKRAAKVYGLEILKPVVNESSNNSTRFVIISSKKQYVHNAGRISISFEARHESGALYKILSHFYNYGINLEKIESRPVKRRNWEYRFFVDISGNLSMQCVNKALAAVNAVSDGMAILGNY